MRRIKAVVYGVGAMNSVATRMMLEKGVDIVGALARSPDKVGRDLGDVAGLIRAKSLPRSFGEKLHPYVRGKFDEIWVSLQNDPIDPLEKR